MFQTPVTNTHTVPADWYPVWTVQIDIGGTVCVFVTGVWNIVVDQVAQSAGPEVDTGAAIEYLTSADLRTA